MPCFGRHVSRRRLLRDAAALGALLAGAPAFARPARAQGAGPPLGEAEGFSWPGLVARVEAMARAPYRPPPRPAPELVQRIDYDAHGKLRLHPEFALWGEAGGVYPVAFVHLGRWFPKSVRLYALDAPADTGETAAREILYRPEMFTVPPDHPAAGLPPEESAFAGFWLQESRRSGDWSERAPWASFVGATYFRTVGALGQVGLSARAVALDVGDPGREEFPDFTRFWLAPAEREGEPQLVYALLDGPSIVGACRLALTRGRGVTVEVESHLIPRRDIARLGIAPLTSMFWYGEHGDQRLQDWRPEVHDSDGLAIWTGAGERLWRPLANPPRIAFSSFADRDPRGFGLAQRDRNYDHYLDGVNYHLRPTCWIEPRAPWGPGAVQLVELPTDDEIHDNIVACWLPEGPARAGEARTWRYRMHWQEFVPFFPVEELARCVATRTGRGGEQGRPRPPGRRKFALEFDGAILGSIPWGVRPDVLAEASRGTISLARAEPVHHTARWLASFDLEAGGPEPVELRCRLALGGEPISETWLFQYFPEG